MINNCPQSTIYAHDKIDIKNSRLNAFEPVWIKNDTISQLALMPLPIKYYQNRLPAHLRHSFLYGRYATHAVNVISQSVNKNITSARSRIECH